MNEDARIFHDGRNHCKDMLDDNIKDKVNIHSLRREVYNKYK